MRTVVSLGGFGVLLALLAYWRWRDEDPIRTVNRRSDRSRR